MTGPAWPFSTAELTAGLRRYFAESGLHIRSLAPAPARLPDMRGLQVTYEAGGDLSTIECVLKEPHGRGRTGLAHPGVREAGVYRSLASQLPMPTPALIAAHPDGDWLVLEAVDGQVGGWDASAYEETVALLVRLHERFWGLADDLAAYPWLARPLTLDYEIHVYAAAQALGHLVREEWPPLIVQSPATLTTLGLIISEADHIIQPLRAMPFTLLHGDYWEGNLLRDDDGDLIVCGWHRASIGPCVLDLLTMLTTCQWERGRLPINPETLITRYRHEIFHCLGVEWSDAEWAELWDHALLWHFLQETLSWLAGTEPEAFAPHADRFQAIWLDPVMAAAHRRLQPIFSH